MSVGSGCTLSVMRLAATTASPRKTSSSSSSILRNVCPLTFTVVDLAPTMLMRSVVLERTLMAKRPSSSLVAMRRPEGASTMLAPKRGRFFVLEMTVPVTRMTSCAVARHAVRQSSNAVSSARRAVWLESMGRFVVISCVDRMNYFVALEFLLSRNKALNAEGHFVCRAIEEWDSSA